MKFMEGVPDKAYDLAIIDVPYGIDAANMSLGKGLGLYRKGGNYKRGDWDKNSPDKKYWAELFRVSESQIIWGANHFISSIPYDSPGWIFWDKNNGGSDFADGELAWSSFDKPLRKFKYTWSGFIQGDMKRREDRIHPTQKPIPLYKWLLKHYAKLDDKILDTHGGSMSIAIACYDLGFSLDLCELDEDYFKAGKARYEAHVAKYAPASEIPVTPKGEIKLF